MSDFRKLGVPFVVIFLSALVSKLITMYFSAAMSGTALKIIIVISLCIFGATLNHGARKRSRSVWKKVVAVLLVIFLLFMQLDLFTFKSVSEIFMLFGVDAFYINMLYIFCGYMFVD